MSRENRTVALQTALDKTGQLHGIIHICSGCMRVRNDKGGWEQFESDTRVHAAVRFSHGICPDCVQRLYPDLYQELYPEFDE